VAGTVPTTGVAVVVLGGVSHTQASSYSTSMGPNPATNN